MNLGKKYYLVLGNGFSMDLIQHLKSNSNLKGNLELDLSNLFVYGDVVKYPSLEEPGFLSKKYTPNLWSLGARPTLGGPEAMEIVENLITCANVSLKSRGRDLEEIYKSAYQELTAYLKYLFIHYNSLISDADLKAHTQDWPWLKFLKKINESEEVSKIHIVTYNYDIWLERIFKLNKINFSVGGIEDSNQKIIIYKPHGSISFTYNKPIEDPTSFKIVNTAKELVVGGIRDYNVKYENLDKEIYSQNAMIPPAGDSASLDALTDTWAGTIRDAIKQSKLEDTLIISGLSYWHVDRGEVDNILISLPSDINVKTINPFPSKTLETVLSGLFKNSIHYSASSILNHISV